MRKTLLICAAIAALFLCSGQRCDLTPLVDALQTGDSPFRDEVDFFDFDADAAADNDQAMPNSAGNSATASMRKSGLARA